MTGIGMINLVSPRTDTLTQGTSRDLSVFKILGPVCDRGDLKNSKLASNSYILIVDIVVPVQSLYFDILYGGEAKDSSAY